MTRLILISKSSANYNNEKLASLFIKKLDYILNQLPNYVAAYVERLATPIGGSSSTSITPTTTTTHSTPLTNRQFDELFYSSRREKFTRIHSLYPSSRFYPHYQHPSDLIRDQKLYYYLQTLNIHENIVYYNNLILGLIVLFLLFSLLVLFEENAFSGTLSGGGDEESSVYSWSTITFVLLNTFVFVLIVFTHNFFKQFILNSKPPEFTSSVLSDDEETPTKTRLRKDQRTVISLENLAHQHHSSQKSTNDPDPIMSSISFLLCVFDNIVGPKIVHHWLLDQRQLDHVDEQLLKYVAVHTLNGELYQDKLHSNLKYRLYLIQEVDRAIFSVFFDASTIAVASSSSNIASNHSAGDLLMNSHDDSQSSGEAYHHHQQQQMSSSALKRHHAASMSKLNAAATTSLNSFSMIVPLERKDILLKYFGDTTRFFLNAFENIVLEFKIYAHIKPKSHHITKAIENLTQSLKEFVSNMITLKVRGLYPCHQEDEKAGVDFKIHIKDTFLNDCFFTTPVATSINNQDKQNFLINAITSHLITNCRTIVVGKTSASINKLINTLALFMPKELLRTSCYALEENSMLSPYFALQGFVTENPEDLNSILNSDFLFKRDTPTTIVDLSYKQVYRTATLNDFNALKEDFISKKVKFLYNCLSLDHLSTIFPVNNYLNWISSSSIAQKSTLITSMLKQMDILEIENGSKDAYASLIQKDIYMQSVSLIEYVNNELTSQLNAGKKDTQTSQQTTSAPAKLSARKICKDLDIKSDEDLHILIAHANYLKPGFSLDFYLY